MKVVSFGNVDEVLLFNLDFFQIALGRVLRADEKTISRNATGLVIEVPEIETPTSGTSALKGRYELRLTGSFSYDDIDGELINITGHISSMFLTWPQNSSNLPQRVAVDFRDPVEYSIPELPTYESLIDAANRGGGERISTNQSLMEWLAFDDLFLQGIFGLTDHVIGHDTNDEVLLGDHENEPDNDYYYASNGTDFAQAGKGSDLFSAFFLDGSIDIDLNTGVANHAGGRTTFTGFDRVQGSNSADFIRLLLTPEPDTPDSFSLDSEGFPTGIEASEKYDASGGNGADVIQGGSRSEILLGGSGNDTITGGPGADVLYGQTGSDSLVGLSGKDLIVGSEGQDTIYGGSEGDRLFGGENTDLIFGDEGHDDIRGGGGRDTLEGNAGNDTITGDGSADRLLGGVGNDDLAGGSGADTLIGGAGDDTLSGGGDHDRAEFTVALEDVTLALVPASGGSSDGGIRVTSAEGVDLVEFDVEEILFSDRTVTNDELSGMAAASGTVEPISGTPDADALIGSVGHDTILGLGANDRLVGDVGNDSLDGGTGADTLNGGVGDDTLLGGPASDDLRDVIYAGDGDDSVDAGGGNDLVYGQGGHDTIAGGAGVDELQGQDGDDVITGSNFSDLVFGGAGNDFVNGGFGSDRINGGSGADKFFHVGVRGHGSDWLQDYVAADGDVLLWGGGAATADDFQVNLAHTANAEGERSGDNAVQEAFVIYKPTGQILWALIDGGGQSSINLQIGGETFDVLA